ncbi:major facilitator transporter [Oscillochloris trichoides DG-6]|uniref:Major facilitator transporter n=1 Tax=Oscillochloris trichoides DG-6 TaxID=765420 RepID=E1IBH4_9CHLR|nr:MFS transporter [Oscillochloris trichoides]EFO81393.1 major facilitator transporter [Oscillochloris trichoides DG-6]
MFRNRQLMAVVSGHFMIDVLNSTGAVFLAVLAVPFELSNAQIATALTIYLLIGSLSQPLFGLLADRLQGKTLLLAGIGVAWMGFFYTMVALAPNWTLLLPMFLLAPLGSGLFHPVGTSSAALAEPDRASSATAIFFFGGQVGMALGPFVTGYLTGRFYGLGLLPMALLAFAPAVMLIVSGLHQRGLVQHASSAHSKKSVVTMAMWLIIAFVVLVAVRSSIQAIYQAFLPKLFSDRGWDPTMFGLLAGVFMGAGAIGQIVTGNLADRFGMRQAIIWPLLLSVPAGLVCFLSASIWVIFASGIVTGFLIGGQHSVLVVHAQRLLPVKQSFAAGLILGFTFASGTLGTWLAGQFADQVGLQNVMVAVTLLGIPAAALAVTLPGTRRRNG